MHRLPLLALLLAAATATPAAADAPAPRRPLVLDMVHHNPGEPRLISRYEDPAELARMGYDGKVYFLFDAPTIAVDWESVDPEIFPRGSEARAWVDAKAAQIDAQHAACAAAGIKVYAMADLVLLPKTLVAKYGLEKTYGDPTHPQTDRFLRALIDQMFARFPRLDGLFVRIGETYLQDAPFHQGHIENKHDAGKTIIPLARLLREEVCAKRGKQLIFRTWLSFDTELKTYQAVSDAVEPHPLLSFGVKHCEGDFHRGNAFSKILGEGRHPQLVEVQCAREYEGKGAYPNYIAKGVIDGFEEHLNTMPNSALRSIGEFARTRPEHYAGLWTWTRGGGWFGPFIAHELWPDLNAWVLAQWAHDPAQSEETLFHRYATERLGLRGDDVARFRRLCLLSADAAVRGKNSTFGDISPWWSRDDGINVPGLPTDPARRARVLAEKAEAVRLWEQIVELGETIHFPDPTTADHVSVSTRYGLTLYRIYHAVFELVATGDDPERLRLWLERYDAAWADHHTLPSQSSQCATLYRESSGPVGASGENIASFIVRMRRLAQEPAARRNAAAPFGVTP